jgi:hypothetical protein
MYDTIKMWLPIEEIKDSRYLNRVPTLLSNIGQTTKENGIEYVSGSLDNLKVSIGQTGISINGSINKYFHNDNFHKLTRQETELSINKLSDVLGINFENAKIQRLDISHNFIMNEPAENYYSFLGECTHYKKMVQPSSLYFQNKLKTLLFYNKVAEGEYRKQDIPMVWQNRNVLRYEMRYTSRLASQLNMPIVMAKDLYSENMYIELIDKWIEEYFKIKKNKLFKPKSNNMTSKNAKEFLLSALVEIVGQNEINEIAKQWKPNFTTSKEAQRFKKDIQNLKGMTEQSPLIEELDKKIARVKEFYR